MALSLPLEVQQRIFHFAIPRPSRTSILERNRTLCRVAVVSKIWCRLARAELVAHLDVKHPGKPLLNRLAAPKDQITPDALDADQVRSIVFRRAGETAEEKMAEVERLLELCKNVDEIWLESASKAGGRDIRMLNRVKDLPSESLLFALRAPDSRRSRLTGLLRFARSSHVTPSAHCLRHQRAAHPPQRSHSFYSRRRRRQLGFASPSLPSSDHDAPPPPRDARERG